MRIAIVGGGIAGLVAAHLLHPDHDILLFEANAYPGGHSHTVPVTTPSGQWPVDTGFIVYNERNYPAFTALLARLGVATQPTTMSFSVRSEAGGFEYNGSSLNQLFGQRTNLLRPSFYRMAADILRFARHAPRAIRDGAAALTLGEYARDAGYSDRFLAHYLIPMASALWSQPQRRVPEMPLAFLVQFLDHHGMLRVDGRPQWRVVRGGSARYVETLTRPFAPRLRLGHPVRAVRRVPDGVMVDGERFDEVVLACHADQALALLEDPTAAEREILSAIPYQANEVVLHTDMLDSLGLQLLARLIDSDVFLRATESGAGIFELNPGLAAAERKQFMPIVEWVSGEPGLAEAAREAAMVCDIARSRSAFG